jgi:ABC-2 type transport system permease protein
MRLLLAKDIKTFRRDPMHWLQFSIFMGLMVMYLLYMRRFQYDKSLETWMTVIGYMNVAVIGLLLATFMTRFVFPMISLEGRRIWILGTLPIRRSSILLSKFVFACGVSVIPCGTVILLSDFALHIVERQPVVALLHQLTSIALCLGLSSLAIGLGARLPTLREDSPSRIAAGFGGTLTLVLSTAFVFTLVAVVSIPAYFRFSAKPEHDVWYASNGFMATALGLAFLLSALVIYFPMYLGLKSFQNVELK